MSEKMNKNFTTNESPYSACSLVSALNVFVHFALHKKKIKELEVADWGIRPCDRAFEKKLVVYDYAITRGVS